MERVYTDTGPHVHGMQMLYMLELYCFLDYRPLIPRWIHSRLLELVDFCIRQAHLTQRPRDSTLLHINCQAPTKRSHQTVHQRNAVQKDAR